MKERVVIIMSKTYSNDFYGGFLAGIEFERNRANSKPLENKVDAKEPAGVAFWERGRSNIYPYVAQCSVCGYRSPEVVHRTYFEPYCPSCKRKMKIRNEDWSDTV